MEQKEGSKNKDEYKEGEVGERNKDVILEHIWEMWKQVGGIV